MQTRSSDENSVCLSVCLSIKRVHCDKTKEKISLDFYTIRQFSEKKNGWWGDPFYLKYWVNRHHWSEIADFEQIIARSYSAVTPSEKSSVNTNRKLTTRFPTSLRWLSYVAPKSPKGAQKRKSAVFPLKSHFAWRKSATKFLCVKTVSGKVVRHSLA